MTQAPIPATLPTLHFIGVSTGQSSIMSIFPRWAEALGLGPCAINGIDLPLHAGTDAYRAVVGFIKADPCSMGALVTAHKIDLLHASEDLFDGLDPHAQALHEVSCLSKQDGRLIGHAKDPISARLALNAIVPAGHWQVTGGDVFTIGAGGATTAITWNLMRPDQGQDRPRRIIVSDVNAERLAMLRQFHATLKSPVPVDYELTT
jgi:shikimate 5-dehydrogenase